MRWVLLATLVTALASPAGAELSGTVWPDFHYTATGTDGPVYACCKVSGLGNFVAGDFDHVGDQPVANIFQAIDLGEFDCYGTLCEPLGEGLPGTVRALASYEGKLIAAGAFPNRVARWDGTSWTYMPGIPSTVRALFVNNGQLLAGGSFGVSAWTGEAWQAMGDPPVSVRALAVFDGKLVAAGAPADNICYFSDGSWELFYPGWYFDYYDTIHALCVFDGHLYAGGDLHADPELLAMDNLGYWDGAAWNGLGYHSPAGPVHALLGTWSDYLLLVGGDFPTHLGHWSGESWVDYYGIQDTDGPIYALAGAADDAFIGGDFSRYGPTEAGSVFQSIFVWGQVRRYGFAGEGLNNHGLALVEHAGSIVVGGRFAIAGSAIAGGVARWEAGHWAGMDEGFGYSVEVRDLCSFAGGLYATGIREPGVQRWDGLQWTALAGDFAHGCNVLAEYDGRLHVGGSFTTVDGTPCARVACRQDSTWIPLGEGISGGSYPDVGVLASHAGLLFAGGDFAIAGGQPAANIAGWDGTTWQSLGQGVDAEVRALLSDGDRLVVGGFFNSAGGQPARAVAAWDGATWTALGSNIVGGVHALARFGGWLLAAGNLSLSDDPAARDLVYWDGATWRGVVSTDEYQILAMQARGDELWLTGHLTAVGGVRSNNVAVFEIDATAAGDGQPGALVLRPCHPNPFNPRTTLRFTLSAAGPARLSIHDVQGRHLRLLMDGDLPAGEHALNWDGLDDAGKALPSGVYFSRLEAGGEQRSGKLVLSR